MSVPGRSAVISPTKLARMQLPARRLGPWIAAAVLIVIGSVAMAVSALPKSSGTSADVQSRPSANAFVFGLDYADELPEESSTALGASLNDAGAVGAGWIRMDLAWYRVQPTPDVWDWSPIDRVVAAAKARGLKVLAIVDQAPQWARQARCADQLWCQPADPTKFAAFAAKAAQRYPADVVSAWEVWNEENLHTFWLPGPNPAAYSALLKATAVAVTAVQPKARIVFGGLAIGSSPGSMSAHDFLLGAARAGGLAYVGAVAYHPYTFPAPPASAKAFTDLGDSPDGITAVLDDYQASSLPIWLTETGAPVPDADSDPASAGPATRTEEQAQAAYATALVKAATANPRIKALFWFSDIDLPGQQLYFGLRRADGTRRPSFDALHQAITASQH